MSNSLWKMPDWMKPLEPYFNDRGALSVEASMNLYGAKCGNRLATADPDIHALIINAQVGLLVALQGAGLLGGGKAAVNLPEMAQAIDDKFEAPMALFREETPPHRAFEFLRQEVATILKEAGHAS